MKYLKDIVNFTEDSGTSFTLVDWKEGLAEDFWTRDKNFKYNIDITFTDTSTQMPVTALSKVYTTFGKKTENVTADMRKQMYKSLGNDRKLRLTYQLLITYDKYIGTYDDKETFIVATHLETLTGYMEITDDSKMYPQIDATYITTDKMGYPVSVQGKTKYNVRVTAHATLGESITQYAVTVEGVTYYGDNITTVPMTTAGKKTIAVTVTDDLGHKKTVNYSKTVNRAVNPMLVPVTGQKELMCYRSDDEGNLLNKSNKIWLKVASRCFDVSGEPDFKNTCKMQIRTKGPLLVWGAWTDLTTDASYDALITGTYPYTNAYQVEVRVIDALDNTTSAVFTVPMAGTPFHLGYGGASVSVGAKDNSPGFHCYFDADFKSDVIIDDNVVKDFVIETGVKDNWRYKKWYGGDLEIWMNKTYMLTTTEKRGNMYGSANTISESYPFTFLGIPRILYSLGYCSSGIAWLGVDQSDIPNTSTTSPKLTLLVPEMKAISTFSVNWYGHGRWHL